jgi:hypothetical protein
MNRHPDPEEWREDNTNPSSHKHDENRNDNPRKSRCPLTLIPEVPPEVEGANAPFSLILCGLDDFLGVSF